MGHLQQVYLDYKKACSFPDKQFEFRKTVSAVNAINTVPIIAEEAMTARKILLVTLGMKNAFNSVK